MCHIRYIAFLVALCATLDRINNDKGNSPKYFLYRYLLSDICDLL